MNELRLDRHCCFYAFALATMRRAAAAHDASDAAFAAQPCSPGGFVERHAAEHAGSAAAQRASSSCDAETSERQVVAQQPGVQGTTIIASQPGSPTPNLRTLQTWLHSIRPGSSRLSRVSRSCVYLNPYRARFVANVFPCIVVVYVACVLV